MKRIFAFLMITVLTVSLLAGCGVNQSQESSNTLQVDGLEIEVLACEFDKEVMGIDEEFSGYGFTERDGKVWVNLMLKIKNNSENDIGEDELSGYFTYDDLRYDLQYELWSVAPTRNNDESIEPGCVAVVSLVNLVDQAAMKEDLTVYYTVLDKQFEKKVAPMDTRTPFEKKVKVSVGDKIDVEGLYEIEVLECKEKAYLQASDYENSEQYQTYEGKFVDLVLKVKNNSGSDFEGVNGYTLVGEEFIRTAERIESQDNTELEWVSDSPMKNGEEGIIHLFVTVEEDYDTSDLAMRFNLAGNCYYCEVE
ncbi:MAG: hypothetical protein IKW04_03055 [Clostridia bacterium]|nr:hypothetical protein [Clostridia bacterium]